MNNAFKALLLLSFVACNSGGGGSSASKTSPYIEPTPTPEPIPQTSAFNVEVVRKVSFDPLIKNYGDFKANINNHKIVLRPVGGYFSEAKVNCYKLGMNADVFKSLFDSQGDIAEIEVSVDSQGPNKVEFRCDVIENDEILEKVSVTILKSIVVSGTNNITALGINKDEIDTLLLDNSALLLTDGAEVHIKLKQFISEKATFATFTKESALETLDNMAGLPGGGIFIEAKKAFGELKVEMRGKDAGKITRLQPKNPKILPRDYSLDGKCFRVSEGTMGEETKKCSGKKGRQGEIGLTGFSGKNGGDTGKLTIEVEKENGIKLDVEFFPGKPSEGGPGGEGGVGGKGGIGSTVIVKSNPHFKSTNGNGEKYKYPDGPDGEMGIEGERGYNGLWGDIQHVSLWSRETNENLYWDK